MTRPPTESDPLLPRRCASDDGSIQTFVVSPSTSPASSDQEAELGLTSKLDEPPNKDIYDRFERREKWSILGMVSMGGLLPLLVGWSFIPVVPQIAKDLESTPSIVSLGVSVSVFSSAIGALVGATYCTYYGRRPIYLFAMPLLFLGSIGVAMSHSVPTLLFWRFVQATGSAPGSSVGAAVIGDIFRREERGRAMSVYFAASLVGLAVAPITAGLAAHYLSWRFMQLVLGCFGLTLFTLIWKYFPETSHPGERGIDKMQSLDALNGRSEDSERKGVVWLNPLAPLKLLKTLNLLLVTWVTIFCVYPYQVLLIPLPYTLERRYGITNEAIVGVCYIAAGAGNMMGTPIIGYISDMTVIRWKKKRNGHWYPEDRLRPALIPALVLVPLAAIVSAYFSTWGEGNWGLAGTLGTLWLSGVGIEMVWGPCAAYIVDVSGSRSAETMAATSSLRFFIISISVGLILPMINTFGTVATHTISAFTSLLGAGLVVCLIKYGEGLRGWSDVGLVPAG